jgi:hypothetical protein
MQIILSQAELEQAIKNYVNDLMNVREGSQLSIELRAGRGIDGFTATVDIVKSGEPIPAKTVVPVATPLSVVTAKPTPRTVIKEEPVVEDEPETEAPVAIKSEQQDAAIETKEEPVAEAATTVRRPLFGNLKKPE